MSISLFEGGLYVWQSLILMEIRGRVIEGGLHIGCNDMSFRIYIRGTEQDELFYQKGAQVGIGEQTENVCICMQLLLFQRLGVTRLFWPLSTQPDVQRTGQTRLFQEPRRLFIEDNVTPDAIYIPHANICLLSLLISQNLPPTTGTHLVRTPSLQNLCHHSEIITFGRHTKCRINSRNSEQNPLLTARTEFRVRINSSISDEYTQSPNAIRTSRFLN